MSWLQLRLDARPDELEKLEGLMLATGSVAVTMEDNADNAVLEPGVGQTPLCVRVAATCICGQARRRSVEPVHARLVRTRGAQLLRVPGSGVAWSG